MSLLQTRKCSQNNLCVSILSLLKNAISCFFASVYEHDGRENLITVEYFNTITTQPQLFSCYPPGLISVPWIAQLLSPILCLIH